MINQNTSSYISKSNKTDLERFYEEEFGIYKYTNDYVEQHCDNLNSKYSKLTIEELELLLKNENTAKQLSSLFLLTLLNEF